LFLFDNTKLVRQITDAGAAFKPILAKFKHCLARRFFSPQKAAARCADGGILTAFAAKAVRVN
jgi:hypothetical protein